MTARLAFSTAIQTDPDILLIDEMLAVGDEEFNYKVIEKINEMKERGITIIFVSHALRLVQQHCSRTLLLSKGKIIQLGETSQVIEKYLQITREHQ